MASLLDLLVGLTQAVKEPIVFNQAQVPVGANGIVFNTIPAGIVITGRNDVTGDFPAAIVEGTIYPLSGNGFSATSANVGNVDVLFQYVEDTTVVGEVGTITITTSLAAPANGGLNAAGLIDVSELSAADFELDHANGLIKIKQKGSQVSWNQAGNSITVTNPDGSTTNIPLGSQNDIHTTGGTFDAATMSIITTDSEGNQISISLSELKKVETRSTTTIELLGDGTSANPLRANVKKRGLSTWAGKFVGYVVED